MAQQLESVEPTQITSTVERWLNSNFKCSKFVYTWTIDGFRTKLLFNNNLISVQFNEEQPRKLQWGLQIFPNAGREDISDIQFGLRLNRGGGRPIDTMVELSILNPHGGKHVHKTSAYLFLLNGDEVWLPVDRDSVLSYDEPMIHDGRLTVRFEINILNTDNTSGQSRFKEYVDELSDDYAQLLESGSYTDVTLVVGTQSFKAHKAVLAARSSVFNAMFQHDMLEASENSVTISDIQPEVFREVLHFIYAGTIGADCILSAMAFELIAAADKYALHQLKEICEDSLAQALSVETAAETLVVAELRNATGLKSQAIDFIKNHAAPVMMTSGWIGLASYPNLLGEFRPPQEHQSSLELSTEKRVEE